MTTLPADSDFISTLHHYIKLADAFVWGPWLLIPLLLGAGLYLMIGLRFMPLLYLFPAFRYLWTGRKHEASHKGELSPFNALMTSMAATVGVGNIVGVATALILGGPGAIFWMWCTAIVGMATKYCEAFLAVRFRVVTHRGRYVGGPMYYIRLGLGKKWTWLALLFAFFGAVASFGIGNMTQVNAISTNLETLLDVPPWATGAVVFFLVGAVLVGGLKRIGQVAGVLVPFMALFYIIFGLTIMIIHYEMIPTVFQMIFTHAFSPDSVVGGLTGSAILVAMQYGMARGMFSNEAGMGSAPIAHATAITNSPVRQGFLGMLDPFLDTIVICTMTAVVILLSGVYVPGAGSGSTLTMTAFGAALPSIAGFEAGRYMVTLAIVLFAFSTILGWSVYGERCAMFLFGERISLPFRILFTLVVPLGAMLELNFIWDTADLFNGLMALPNLVALLLLSPVVFRMTRQYFDDPAHRYRRRRWRFFYQNPPRP
ncbi:sodium:alanine symporter family protein [Phaeovibrio sulfidiphilus]|uniref:Sodium:alanine symporter family protein n=1 Tax=Phaeovibrio sulfidiphilus TaxID=1220600 RepID=A0A8J6YMS7_9PROT|nr:sodium:alanine symporter family protein [Phaeovibrio sulfidiphilus]MBE1237340.1 sodium:alanine symporter family protein [Phaeovibrio sulfidiphilus]